MATKRAGKGEDSQSKADAHPTDLNPTTKTFEFGGPLGAGALVVVLPATVLGLFLTVNKSGSPPAWVLNLDYNGLKSALSSIKLFDAKSVAVVLGWFGFQVILERVLPSDDATGTELRDGSKLQYSINAFKAFVASGLAIGGMTAVYGLKPLVWVADHVVPLGVASMGLSTAIALHMYSRSFGKGALLALGGNTGSSVYDFFIGRELNPRVGKSTFDWKYFCELRPGLIGWAVLNAAFAAKQYTELGRVTDSMVLVNAFQAYYVVDALWNEPAILTTMDIVMDGFGYMLAFGDLAWVPFTYSLQARYLADHPNDLGATKAAAIVALKLLGLYIFRASNSQKNAFRTNPDAPEVKHLKYINTPTGSRLLTSGWWGSARHINYTGDWLMAVAWCLPTGFKTPLTYFYPIYFAVLLIHRAMRDDEKCRHKYGKAWEEYCKKVPYLFVPGLI
ncbi:hypothetical protein SmJEL517_g03422 [Synchytrium microbalum]|uniref:Delta(14)-sterol reductase ERG24 n=1 Tax=Synchytrium microbalum TaxID=1806994 RepID=A0A507C861_9FUNG|nr:uncharacterized protein SmJEL517_g03422 [Synchytrium microbalum]TPX33713.1 hypothetical protein SmJEL517_g03422 [Synchytrium microbalum]